MDIVIKISKIIIFSNFAPFLYYFKKSVNFIEVKTQILNLELLFFLLIFRKIPIYVINKKR